jgi:tetratricopeptide (TPR) repeat protein
MSSTENIIPDLREGDVFYTEYDGRYHVYKLLKKDEAEETFHVLCYAALNEKPSLDTLDRLEVNIYHTPIHSESFTDATFLVHTTVTDDELIGYHEYQRIMESNFEEAIRQATEYYKMAYQLTDEGKTGEAIEHYSKAINLVPTFYEAIDNRAFCKMDLGRWLDAIEDFRLSLHVNPGSLLAEFSIGECYYRLGEFAKAKQQFEKCLELDPYHQVSKDCLLKSEERMRRE